MNKSYILAILFLFFLSCSDLKKGLGLSKNPPDEFMIEKNDPIIMPPNYDLLPPDSKEKKVKKENDSAKKIIKETFENNSVDNQENLDEKKETDLEKSILEKIER